MSMYVVTTMYEKALLVTYIEFLHFFSQFYKVWQQSLVNPGLYYTTK